MSLTEAQVRTAKASERAYKLYDADGLFLLVKPTGRKVWRYRFVRHGKEKLLTLGRYPALGLATARKLRNEALVKLDNGVDPAEEKQEKKAAVREKQGRLFKEVALEWHEVRKHEWTDKYAAQILTRLEADVFPYIGALPIRDIAPAKMLETLKRVEARGVLVTNRRLKQYCSNIFRFGIAGSYCDADPAAPLKGALKSPPRPKRHKALKSSDVPDFFARLGEYDGDVQTRIGINLALLMAPRTTELRAAKWTEFEAWRENSKLALWRIPAERMKMSEEHLVPISEQARQLLLELHRHTGNSEYLFPSDTVEGFMSNNTMLFGLYRMGFHSRATTHGFRSLFSTEANEHGWNSDWVERQLAHDERDQVRGAYNAAQYMPQRRKLMQWWADHLDALKHGKAAPMPSIVSV